MNDDWRNIETAPRDGTYIVGVRRGWNEAETVKYGWCDEYVSFPDRWATMSGRVFSADNAPTHWIMPPFPLGTPA